ncbi:syntaxin-like protein [Achlya hypogyna]|uniref:Syntaxin-like protein n=1 Tax=Achlya hypogyna TaxID=1202772 RepID=A0A1V9Z6C4_ACHHY|nr:syntaxin-like protein [Achlya hypogyna]
MATRDLTRTYVALRTDVRAKVARRRQMVGSPDVHMEGNSLMRNAEMRSDLDIELAKKAAQTPGWVDAVTDVNIHIARIKLLMEKLGKMHTKRLMVRFDNSESDHEREIESITADITNEFRNAERILKAKMNGKDGVSEADAKARQNVQRALATQLQTLSADFRKSQKEYLDRVKNQRQGPAEFEFLSETKKTSKTSGLDGGFMQAQMAEVELAEDLINERDREVQQIATSIQELATIFKELAVLVIDQGTILDRIDYNMEQVVERTQAGVVELEKAETIQKSARPMKCIGILLALITAMTIILMLKHM